MFQSFNEHQLCPEFHPLLYPTIDENEKSVQLILCLDEGAQGLNGYTNNLRT